MFDEVNDGVAVECLYDLFSMYASYAWILTDWKSNALSRVVHALHVHVRTEHGNFAVDIPVCFETLKELLGVVEDSRTGFEGQRPICETFPRSADIVRVFGIQHAQGFIWGVPHPAEADHGMVSIWSVCMASGHDTAYGSMSQLAYEGMAEHETGRVRRWLRSVSLDNLNARRLKDNRD